MTEPLRSTIRNDQARALQRSRAGFVSRVLADTIDWVVVVAIFSSLHFAVELARWIITSGTFSIQPPKFAVLLGLEWLILVIYLTIGWGGNGRTIGKSFAGLRVVRSDGSDLGARRGFFRALVCATFWPWVLLWSLVSRSNSGLHDILLRTAVIYDWSSDS
ncbi:MAG: RDD family protein [Acidimicrobiia bacterium]|nr:RDD family protein [Acidimicrobiia bacterium]